MAKKISFISFVFLSFITQSIIYKAQAADIRCCPCWIRRSAKIMPAENLTLSAPRHSLSYQADEVPLWDSMPLHSAVHENKKGYRIKLKSSDTRPIRQATIFVHRSEKNTGSTIPRNKIHDLPADGYFSPLIQHNVINAQITNSDKSYYFFTFSFNNKTYTNYALVLDNQEEGNNKTYLIGSENPDDLTLTTNIFELLGDDSLRKLSKPEKELLNDREMLPLSREYLYNLNYSHEEAHTIASKWTHDGESPTHHLLCENKSNWLMLNGKKIASLGYQILKELVIA